MTTELTSEGIPLVEQNDGVRIPRLGFGTYNIGDDARTADAVVAALEMGYRRLDSAALYGNERGVGEGIRQSGLPREEVFVATKLHEDIHSYERTFDGFQESLDKLQLDYVDHYLIHWPQPKVGTYVEVWRAFEAIQAAGRARSIGVCNVEIPVLERLIRETDTVPALNQIEIHPGLQQDALVAANAAHGVLTEAWSPLGRGQVFDDGLLAGIARKHDRTVSQVVLRWHVERGICVIPKSGDPERIRENMMIFDFSLDDEDHAAIRTLETGVAAEFDPDRFR